MLTRPSQPDAGFSYTKDLAVFVRDRWSDVSELVGGGNLLPDITTLEAFFSTCYHASLLREEERPVTFRAILAEPALFASDERPPEGLQRLDFSPSLVFHPSELRRLSVATELQRTLIAVRQNEQGVLQIWGLINSGTRWLRDIRGGRRAGAPLPPAPVVHVDAPGSIEAYQGYELVGKLRGGRLTGARVDLFESQWLPAQFSRFRDKLMERHKVAAERARELSDETWAPLEPTLPRKITERLMKRVISVLRDARHGGTIIFVPQEQAADLATGVPYIDLKYRFAEGQSRFSFPDLIVDILNRLARVYGIPDERPQGPVNWQEFETTTDDELATLDEALFETAHLIAGLASADGAVVMSEHHELLGFGGMISGGLAAVRSVARALDLEGEKVAEDETGNVGARHQSAYRLAAALPGVVVVVISQDGSVRFVCQRSGRVTYWDQE